MSWCIITKQLIRWKAFETKSGIITWMKNVFLPPSSCLSKVWKAQYNKVWKAVTIFRAFDCAETKWVLFSSGNMTPLSSHHGNSEKQTAQCVCRATSPLELGYHYSASQRAVAWGNCCWGLFLDIRTECISDMVQAKECSHSLSGLRSINVFNTPNTQRHTLYGCIWQLSHVSRSSKKEKTVILSYVWACSFLFLCSVS